MTLIPEDVRESIEHLRQRLHGAIDKVFHRDHQNRDEHEPRKPEVLARQPERLSLSGALPLWLGQPDIDETDDDVTIRAELPNLEASQLRVEVSGRTLWLRAEQKHEHEERRGDFIRFEGSYGAFQHAIPLPCQVVAEKSASVYRDGVLTITLPKSEDARAKPVKVLVK